MNSAENIKTFIEAWQRAGEAVQHAFDVGNASVNTKLFVLSSRYRNGVLDGLAGVTSAISIEAGGEGMTQANGNHNSSTKSSRK